MNSARTSVPEAVTVSPAGQEDADQGSGVSIETPESIAGKPYRDIGVPAALRQSLFTTEEPATAEDSRPRGRKARADACTKASADVMARTTDPAKIVSHLIEWLDLAGINSLIALLQDESRRQSIRVVPNPGQMAFA